MSVVLGIDTGGTFTDFVLVDHERGTITTAKVPSTPGDPPRAICSRARAARRRASGSSTVVIGTTVATNASSSAGARGRSSSPTRLRGRAVHRPDGQGADLRPRTGRSRSRWCRRRDCYRRRRPVRQSRRRDRRRSRRRSSSDLQAEGCAAIRRRGGGGRHLLPVLVSGRPSTSSATAEAVRAALPERARLALARGLAALARVRAREHDDRRRLREAGRQPLRRARRRRAR